MTRHLRPFRYFLALAEELHFGRAARRMGIAQPPLTRQIQALERDLGVVLFRRTKHKVELTAAGAAFAAEARHAVEQVDRAIERAQQSGRSGRLDLIYTNTVVCTPVFATVLREFRRLHPFVQLALTEMSTARQIEAIADGQADLGFIRSQTPEHPKSIVLARLMREAWVVALRADHPLAAAAQIAPEALAGEPLVVTPRGTWLCEQAIAICGHVAGPLQEARQIGDALSLVAAGLGLSVVPDSARAFAYPDLVFRPLMPPPPPAEVALAHRRSETSPLVQALVALAVKSAKHTQSLYPPLSPAASDADGIVTALLRGS